MEWGKRDRAAVVALHGLGIRTVRIWEHDLRRGGSARQKIARALARAASPIRRSRDVTRQAEPNT